MLRGQQITQDAHQFIGEVVFVSAHARRGSGQRQYRGTLTGVSGDSLIFKGGHTFRVNTHVYDVMLSKG